MGEVRKVECGVRNENIQRSTPNIEQPSPVANDEVLADGHRGRRPVNPIKSNLIQPDRNEGGGGGFYFLRLLRLSSHQMKAPTSNAEIVMSRVKSILWPGFTRDLSLEAMVGKARILKT